MEGRLKMALKEGFRPCRLKSRSGLGSGTSVLVLELLRTVGVEDLMSGSVVAFRSFTAPDISRKGESGRDKR